MAPLFAIIRYALLETFFCIPILPKTIESLFWYNKTVIMIPHEWRWSDAY